MAERTQALWLHAGETVSIDELATVSGFTVTEIRELVEYGALTPAGEALFSASCVGCVRRAARLREDLELEMPVLALVVSFLDRSETLESELRKLSAKIPR